jgi:acyloxyacyl hydrolase
MAPKQCLVASLVFALLLLLNAPKVSASANGGIKCSACVVLVRMFELALYPKSSAPGAEEVSEFIQAERMKEAVGIVCNVANKLGMTADCDAVSGHLSRLLPRMLASMSPDQICGEYGVCLSPETCYLYPPRSASPFPSSSSSESAAVGEALVSFSSYLGSYIRNLTHSIYHGLDYHVPVDDPDHDMFSHEYTTLRGRSWRGRDCDGQDSRIYPGSLLDFISLFSNLFIGRKPYNGDKLVDSNCNGIFGVDESGTPYEDLFCSG